MRTSLLIRVALILLCAAIMLSASIQAQFYEVPNLISYQGRLTDTDGDPVTDGEYEVTFTIWNDSTSTSPEDRVWISPNCTVLVVNGLFNWQLGSKVDFQPWYAASYFNLWLGIQVETDSQITPRTRLCSVPYAHATWYAHFAERAGDANNAYNADTADFVHGRIVSFLNESENHTTDPADGTFDVSFPPSTFSDAPDIVQCRVVLREPAGGLLNGVEAYANVSGITQGGFMVEVVEYKGSGTTVNDTDVTLFYLVIQLE